MFQGRKAQKILANMLICLMMLTNPAVVPAVQAMTAAEKPAEQQQTAQDSTSQSVTDTVYTVDKSTNRQEVQVAAGTADGDRHLSTQPTTAKEKAFRFGNSLLSYYLNQGKNHGPQWLKTTSLSFFVGEDFKPVYSFETIQPFGEINDRDSLWFWQGRYAHSGDASTANIGLGWRKLSADKHSMVGYNLFYDYGFQYDLARIGFGGEYFNKQAEYRFNVYHPVFGDRLTNVSYLDTGILYSYIRAVDGLDLEMGTSLPHAQWMKWYLKGYYYDNKHSDDELGYQLRTTMQISPRFQLEWGYRHSNLNHEPYASFKYQLADTPSLSAKNDKKIGDNIDLSYKLLQPVERDNDIKTERYTRLVAYTGSIRITVTNSLSATPIVGAGVQAYQNGAAVGGVIITDASGSALINGLAVGTYTVKVTYASFTADSSPVAVAKDQTTATAVSLAVQGGSAGIMVLNGQSQPVSGASVTATVSTVARAEKSLLDQLLGVQTAYAATSPFSVTVTTDANGVANFTNLPPGTYTFTVNHNGCTMKSQGVAIAISGSSNITMILPTSGGNIQAVVKDSSGAAISGATVRVLSGTTTVATGTTDSNGVAVIGGIVAGNYAIEASKTNYVTNTASVVVTTGETANTSITLTLQNGTAQITVTDGTNPISGATVIIAGSGGTVYSGTTDNTGVASIAGVPVGTYIFTASATGYTNNTASITVTTSGGNATVNLVGAGGSISVTVQDSGNHPISGATVSTVVNGTSYSGTANASGVATISGVPTGTYTFTASATGYTNNAASIAVTTSGGSATVNLAGAGGNVSVTVQDSGSHPISGATVSTVVNGTSYSGTANASGVATISGVPTGTYTFTASATGYTNNAASIIVTTSGGSATVNLAGAGGNVSVTVQDSGSHPISGATVSTVVNGTTYAGVTNASGVAIIGGVPTGTYNFTASAVGYTNNTAIIALSASGGSGTITLIGDGGNVSVTVQDSGSHAISGAAVSTTVNGTTYSGITNASGVAIINGLPTGTYNFTASAAGYTNNTASIIVTTSGGSATVNLAGAGGNVSVTVQDSGSHAISGAAVSTTVNGTTYSGITNASGVAIINGVATGTYDFTASAAGYTNNTASIAVTTSGGSATVNLAGAGGNVTVTVQDSGSHPISGATVSTVVNGTSYSGTANASGVATISGVPTGTYTFTASATGYTNNAASIIVTTSGGSATVNLAGAGGNVTVTVQDSGSHPISGAVVSTVVNGTSYSGTANASGVATISGVPTGTYDFIASATGYTNNTASIAVTISGGSATVNLAGAGGNVSVTVQDSDGTPLSGATVSTTVNDTTYSGTANASGVATISGVPTGTYTFTASATGYINNTASITVTTSGSSGTIPLTLATSLVLQVQDSLGNLVMGQLPIVLTNTSTGKNYSRNLDKTTGTASFNGIPQGTYNCTVSDHFGNQFSYGQIHFVNQSMQLTIAVPMAFYDKIVVKNDNHSQLLWLQVTCTTAVSYNQYSTSDLIINFNAYILQGQKIELKVYAWVKWYDYYALQTSATAAGGTYSINVNFLDFTNITSPTG